MPQPLILFDGVCNLCNGAVLFIIKRDRHKKYKFAPLQSETGKKIFDEYKLPVNDLTSFVLVENDKIYKRSTAALKVAKNLSGMWPLLYAFMILPVFFRDFIYKIVAANRYKWFGKKEACMIPTPELRARFLN